MNGLYRLTGIVLVPVGVGLKDHPPSHLNPEGGLLQSLIRVGGGNHVSQLSNAISWCLGPVALSGGLCEQVWKCEHPTQTM